MHVLERCDEGHAAGESGNDSGEMGGGGSKRDEMKTDRQNF